MDEKAGYIPVDQQQQQQQPQPMAPYPVTAPDVAMSSGESQPPPYPVGDRKLDQFFSVFLSVCNSGLYTVCLDRGQNFGH